MLGVGVTITKQLHGVVSKCQVTSRHVGRSADPVNERSEHDAHEPEECRILGIYCVTEHDRALRASLSSSSIRLFFLWCLSWQMPSTID